MKRFSFVNKSMLQNLGRTISKKNTGEKHSKNENFILCSLTLEKGYIYLVHGYISLDRQGTVINGMLSNNKCSMTEGYARTTGINGGGTLVMAIATNVQESAEVALATYAYDTDTVYSGELHATIIGYA